jgi:hypothetical protein
MNKILSPRFQGVRHRQTDVPVVCHNNSGDILEGRGSARHFLSFQLLLMIILRIQQSDSSITYALSPPAAGDS